LPLLPLLVTPIDMAGGIMFRVVRLSVRAYVQVEASSHRLFRRLSFVFVLMQYIPFFCVVIKLCVLSCF